MNNSKLTRQAYYSLWDKDITKNKYDAVLRLIDARFNYIMATICTKLTWYDYDNGWEENPGHFEPNNYHYNDNSYITFDGEYTLPPPYNNCPDIPIKWLWEDFEDEFKKEVENFKVKKAKDKEREKCARETRKIIKQQFKEIILSKLTKEELKYIKFK